MNQLITALYLTFLCLGAAVAREAQYIIRPSQSQGYCCDRCSTNADSMNNSLTLSQFVNNSIDYLTNDTTLILSPGNYSLESELIVEDVHSFSIFSWPSLSSKAVIVCDHNAKFEFSNVSIVTISGLEFVGCLENYAVSVGQFQLEDSAFYGNDRTTVNGTVLTIVESVANLDKVAFLSIAKQPSALPENCKATTSTTCTHRVIGILLKRSTIKITQSWFEENDVGLGGLIYDEFNSEITIINTTFVNNLNRVTNTPVGVVYANSSRSAVKIYDSIFANNVGIVISGKHCNILITRTKFINNTVTEELWLLSSVLSAWYTNMSISHCEFVGNNATSAVGGSGGVTTTIDHCKFISNTGKYIIGLWNQSIICIIYSELVDNTATHNVAILNGDMITVSMSKFINNRAEEVMWIQQPTKIDNLANNMFVDNSATYEVYIEPGCRPGLGLSLGSRHCIQCPENWRRDLIGIVVAASIAGIALVIFMLALNMTVAFGTLNGILFYAHIVAASAETYFMPFTTPNFITVFISWLNLDIGFDVCFFISQSHYNFSVVYKTLIRLAFPAYINILVIIVIVASECSSKFAKIIGKCNPVAVLATMILLSYAKLFSATLTSLSLLYKKPAYGSRQFDVTKFGDIITGFEHVGTEYKAVISFLIVICLLVVLLCIIYSVLIFSWQWLLRYQNKAIFKWMRYQKLHHFLEPYHTPYILQNIAIGQAYCYLYVLSCI